MTNSRTSRRNQMNKSFKTLNSTYHMEFPLDEIKTKLAADGMFMVQEDGTPWSGIFCGSDGDAGIALSGIERSEIRIMWHTMQSGKFEMTVYIP